jgi:iron complex outermembrane receptor protein
MAYMPKINCIAGACALLFIVHHQAFAEDTQLSPVVVTGTPDGLISQELQAGFGGRWIDQTQSINSITKEQIEKTIAQRTSEVVRNDTSIQANYTPLGYYEGFAIRGFSLDYGTGYQLNGMPLASEASIAMENKERIEVIKGISGVNTGAMSPGGYINYVTKRPSNINSFTIGYGERGTFSQSVDFGRWLNSEKTLGIRLNAANEDIKPYAKEATGHREFISVSMDALPSSYTKIETDFDYQKKKQFSQPGYQLLGGTDLPSINPEQVLAVQPWRKPVATEQTNFGTRIIQDLNLDWKVNVGYQISHILASDNSSFPWGGNSTGYYNYFSQNGDFTISDFHSNQEVHHNQEIKAELIGKIKAHNLEHKLIFGSSLFTRRISQPNYVWDLADGDGSYPSNGQAAGNIFSAPNGYAIYPGSTATAYDNFHYTHKQKSIYINDQITGLDKFTLTGGVKILKANEEWSGYSTGENSKNKALPSAAISYKLSESISNYISYSKGLELGARAPLIATNLYMVMPNKITSQIEMGSKALLAPNLQASFAIFEIKKPYEYTTIMSGNYGDFVQRGTEQHTGIEASLAGNVTSRLGIQVSATAIHAITKDTGDQFDGKYAMNVPKFKISSFASYKIPGYEQTSLNGGVTYEGSKYARRDNSVSVPSFYRFDAGITQNIRINDTKARLNFYIENLFNKKYWRDVPEFLGDAYLLPGTPIIMRATATFDF